MQLEDDMPGFFWQVERFHCIGCTAGRVGVNHQVAVLIIATSSTNGCYKTLGITVDGLIAVVGSRLVPGVLFVEHLVVCFEKQLLVIVLELLGYLFPQPFILGLVCIIAAGAGLQP